MNFETLQTFGFIEFDSKEEAASAISKFNGMEVQGKKLVVNEARPQEKRNNNRRPAPRRRSY